MHGDRVVDDALVSAAECCPGRFVRDGLLVVVPIVVKLGEQEVLGADVVLAAPPVPGPRGIRRFLAARLAEPALLQAAGQPLPAGQQATEENDRTVRKPGRQTNENLSRTAASGDIKRPRPHCGGGGDAEAATAAYGPVSPVSLSPGPCGQRQLMPKTAGSAIADGLHRAAALRFACIALLGRYR